MVGAVLFPLMATLNDINPLFNAYLWAGIALMIMAYIVNRAGYFIAAAWSISIYLMVLPFIQFWSHGVYAPIGINQLAALLLPAALHAYFILSIDCMLITSITSLIGLGTLPSYIPGITWNMVVAPLAVLGSIQVGLLISAIMRVYDQRTNMTYMRELAESERRYRDLFNATSEGLVIHRAGIIRAINPAFCQMSGYTQGDLIGMPIIRLFAPEYQEQIPRLVTLKEPYQVQGIRKDGTREWVEIAGREHMYEGVPVRVAAIRDIGKQKENEARRLELAIEREKIDMLQRFIGDLSHDLRTPLSVIKTSTYLIRKLKADPDKVTRHLAALDAQADQLQRIFDDLLHMSRLDRDTTDYNFAWRDPSEVIQMVVADQAEKARAKQLTVTLTLPDRLPRFLLDEQEFTRMLKNLLINAITYTPEGGRISVRASMLPAPGQPAEELLAIIIEDNGIGIRPRDLPLIFERFYRADTARNTETGGAGLGLSIALKIAQAHRGTITVESAEGKGSCFSVHIPRTVIPPSLHPLSDKHTEKRNP